MILDVSWIWADAAQGRFCPKAFGDQSGGLRIERRRRDAKTATGEC